MKEIKEIKKSLKLLDIYEHWTKLVNHSNSNIRILNLFNKKYEKYGFINLGINKIFPQIILFIPPSLLSENRLKNPVYAEIDKFPSNVDIDFDFEIHIMNSSGFGWKTNFSTLSRRNITKFLELVPSNTSKTWIIESRTDSRDFEMEIISPVQKKYYFKWNRFHLGFLTVTSHSSNLKIRRITSDTDFLISLKT